MKILIFLLLLLVIFISGEDPEDESTKDAWQKSVGGSDYDISH